MSLARAWKALAVRERGIRREFLRAWNKADDRAAAATIRLVQRDGAIQRVVDQMLRVEREGTPEAAIHARRWLAVIEAEVRR